MNIEFLIKIAYALGIGILMGLERSMGNAPSADTEKDDADPIPRPSRGWESAELIGIRTYSILSLVGFTSAVIGEKYPVMAPILMGGAVVLVIMMYARSREDDFGITTEASAIATCGLGAICFFSPGVSSVIAVIITVLLAAKPFTKRAVGMLRRAEVTDTLKFLVIIFIILPILPDRALDMYNAFNPYKVAFLIILISGISFVGYFLTKFLGADRGLGLTGFLGGLTSSTAVTAAMSNQVKSTPDLAGPCAFATVLANATMFGRVLVIVAILDIELARLLSLSMGTMTVTAALAVIVLWRYSKRKNIHRGAATGELTLSNPFSLGPAVKFAIFFTVILFFAKIAKAYLGERGIYLASLVSGLADVDAIILSITEDTRNMALARQAGAMGITIAVVANSVVKSGIAFFTGGRRFGLLVGAILLTSTCAGLLALLVV